MQIGSAAEPPLASFLFVLRFYGESLGGCGYVTVLRTDALQARLDRARGELFSDTRTLIFHLKIRPCKVNLLFLVPARTYIKPPCLALIFRFWLGDVIIINHSGAWSCR